VLIKHRGPPEALTLVENILRCFGSRYVYLSYAEHDLVTANTQAVTHAAFLRYVNRSTTHFSFILKIRIVIAWELHGALLNHTHGSKDFT
jgi:prephenate dehydrogenase